MKYEITKDGEWFIPVRRGYRMACCDCSLVHTVEFRLVKRGRGRSISMRAFRNERATAAKRRKRKKG